MRRQTKLNAVMFVVVALCVAVSVVLAFALISGKETTKAVDENKEQLDAVVEVNNEKNSQQKKTDIMQSVSVKEKEADSFSAIELAKVSNVAFDVESEFSDISRVSFVAVGDNIIHSTVMSDAATLAEGTDKEYNFVPMFENVADIIEEADVAFINQEAPIAGKSRGYAGYPMFNSPEQVVYDLSEIGFDIFNIANNHMLDRHTSGYKSTIDFYKENNYFYLGGFENKEDYENIRIMEKDGITIAFLSYTYGTNGLVLDKNSEMIIPLCDSYSNDEIDRQSKLARELADVVVVSMHWGAEHWSDSFNPIALQKKQAEILVNNNVDVIIGTHPHALEPMLWMDRPDGKRTLVMYSLGNFLSGMEYMRNHVGGIAGFDFVKIADEVHVSDVYFIPTLCHFNNRVRSFKIYKLSEYTPELLRQHGTQVRGTDTQRSMEYLYSIVDATIDKEFLVEDFYKNR